MPDVFVSKHNDKESITEKKIPRKLSGFDISRKHLSSYCYLPENMRFETQGESEQIILLLRKHGITNLSWLILSFLLVLVPLFLFPFLTRQNFLPLEFGNLKNGILLVWYLFTSTYFFVNFLLWYFTVSIITNERIIDVDFINIMHKEFSATSLEKVEDVSMKRGGLISALFDYGDVFVQTAGTNANFEFLAVPHPEEVVRVINNLMEKM